MLPQERSAEQYLRTYLRVLWRRKLTIVACTAIVGAVAFASTATKTSLYKATAHVLLRPRTSESLFDPAGSGGNVDPNRNAATQILVITGEPVRELVKQKLGAAPAVKATSVVGTDIVNITSVSSDPAYARTVANAYATSYIEYRKSSDVEDLATASKTIQEKITDLQRQIDNYDNQIAAAPVDQRPAIENAVKSERDGLIAQVVGLRQTFDRIQLNTSLNRGGAQVVTQARVPSAPFEPKPIKSGLTGAIVGLVFGVSLALVRDLLDDTVKTTEDVEQASGGLRVIGLIPVIGSRKDRNKPVLITQDQPDSLAGEAYRSLRTSTQFMGRDSPHRTLQITSPSTAEGKTTTLANLAVVLSRAGQRVVVVCCDLRRPRIHELFGLTNAVGLTSVLLGDIPLSAALQKVPDEERLFLLASGPEPPNPSELLSGMRTVEVFTALQGTADVVLIDSPPVLPVADAVVISTRVDATILVVLSHSTRRKHIARAMQLLHQVEAPLVGSVLNGVREDEGYAAGAYGGYGRYGYEYSYGGMDISALPSRRRPRETPR